MLRANTSTHLTFDSYQHYAAVICELHILRHARLTTNIMEVKPQISWPTEKPQYDLRIRIGNGAFSSVWKASCKSNSTEVAIKIMDLENISTSFEDILQEVQTMRLCDDPNVLRCYCSFVHLDELWLVTQLMDKGSCLRVMTCAAALNMGEGMNEEWLAYILKEALQGLKYLHDNGQIHRDIKSGNILLDSSGGVRIADFGVSGWTVARGQRQETVKTFVGTPCWMAPEVMEQVDGYDNKADIWSVGITALELAKGSAPYAKYPPMRVLVLTIEEDPPSLKSYDNDRQRTGAPFSRTFEDFVKKCLCKVASSRPSAGELLKHRFLRGRTPDALVHQLLDHISTVGSDVELHSAESTTQKSDGDSGEGGNVGLSSTSEETSTVRFKLEEPDKPFVSGATWVFDTGASGVYDGGNSSKEVSTIDEFMDHFDEEAATIRTPKEKNDTSNRSTAPTDVGSGPNDPPPAPVTNASTSQATESIEDTDVYQTKDFLDELEEELGSTDA